MEVIEVPELQREHVTCLHHLATLLVRSKDKGSEENNKLAHEQAASLLTRANSIQAAISSRKKLPLPTS